MTDEHGVVEGIDFSPDRGNAILCKVARTLCDDASISDTAVLVNVPDCVTSLPQGAVCSAQRLLQSA